MVVVLDELADVAVGRDLAVQLDLRGRGAALTAAAAAETSGARRGVGMLVAHDDVAKGRRISRLGFVGNSTSKGRSRLAVIHLGEFIIHNIRE